MKKPSYLAALSESLLKVTIEVNSAPHRADQLLLLALKKQGVQVSRNQLKKWFHAQQVLWNGRTIDASFELPLGKIELQVPQIDCLQQGAAASIRGSFLPILYEDATLLILNKSSGTPSAPQSAEETETAVGSALAAFPRIQDVGDQLLEPGLVHRLDTGTSGALVFAKTQAEFLRLKELWKKRQIEKIYRAICLGSPSHDLPLRLDFPLAHHSKSKKRMIALTDPKMSHYRGHPIPAITHILSGFKFELRNNSESLVDLTVQIETGVMHQIRCHLEAWGAPIWGDPIYGKKLDPSPAERLWLHAWKLKIPLPTGQWIEIEAPLPADWPHSS